MKRRILLVLCCAAASVQAQSFITMGRLFATPGERAQLDALRSSGASLPPGTFPGAAGAPGGIGASIPMAGTPGMGAAPVPGAEAAPPAVPEQVQLSGIIRRSSGQTTVFVNGEPRQAQTADRGQTARVQVDGRTVILKPGQSYDPATGAIHETGR
jgi:hypothetical protein